MSLPKHSNAALNGYFDDDIGDDFFEETLGEDWNPAPSATRNSIPSSACSWASPSPVAPCRRRTRK
jgi:hypothetical protein